MALIKIQRFFGAVPNDLLNNPEISFKAKGLYAYLNSKPDNWDFSVERIASQVKEGVESVRVGIQELEKFGYLKRIRYQNEKGFWEIDYMLFEVPTEEESSLGKTEAGKLPKQYNKENNKKDNTKKEEKEVDFKGLNEAVQVWLEYKEKDKKQKYKTASSAQAMIDRLYELSEGNLETANKIVQQSIANNYSGLFPLRSVTKNPSAAPRPAVPASQSPLANQDNHSNYADYVAWCERNNISPQPDKYESDSYLF
jgi:hypothetical protein